MTLYTVEDGLADEFRSHETWDDWVGTMSGMEEPTAGPKNAVSQVT